MQYYSYMMKNLILKLREMTTYIDIKTMDKYLTINDESLFNDSSSI